VIERIHRFFRYAEESVCDEVLKTAHGTALVTPSLPLVWQVNAIRAEDPDVTAKQLAAEAEEVQAAFGHRKCVVHDEPLGARLAPGFEKLGWNVFRVLIMLRRRGPDRPSQPPPGAQVSRAVGAATLAAFRREQPFGWQEEAVRQLAAMDDRYERATRARDFAAPRVEPACACRLYTADGVAQIDEVGTLERRRRRGHATAAVLAAAETAHAEGCAPVFLLTDASDWPQQLYRRLGFSPIGSIYEFLKFSLGGARG
jgi:GNAT superfamily N-acetyltransferase